MKIISEKIKMLNNWYTNKVKKLFESTNFLNFIANLKIFKFEGYESDDLNHIREQFRQKNSNISETILQYISNIIKSQIKITHREISTSITIASNGIDEIIKLEEQTKKRDIKLLKKKFKRIFEKKKIEEKVLDSYITNNFDDKTIDSLDLIHTILKNLTIEETIKILKKNNFRQHGDALIREFSSSEHNDIREENLYYFFTTIATNGKNKSEYKRYIVNFAMDIINKIKKTSR